MWRRIRRGADDSDAADESGAAAGNVTLTTEIVDPEGKVVATANSTQDVPAGKDVDVEQTARLAGARLWSLEQRNLYVAVSTVRRGGR